MKWLPPLLSLVCLASCSSLMVPGEAPAVGTAHEARALLESSARATGDAWASYRKVTVAYDGEWGGLVKRLQPDLVDAGFRKSSVETYDTRRETVTQKHRGPDGEKTVERTRQDAAVAYNGVRIGPESRRDASALVADAYTAFLFGPSWLLRKGESLEVIGVETIGGETCDGVQGRLRPGFGFAEEDRFIAWIGRDSRRMLRLQFTIDGLASTRGADVDVTFSEFWTAGDGSVWPGRFVEWVRRPVLVKAHDWRMEGLEVDGRKLK
jgi:hypothetical protein